MYLQTKSNTIIRSLVGLYRPILSALEFEASVLRAIYSSGELKR